MEFGWFPWNLTKNQKLANILRGNPPLQRTMGAQTQRNTNPNTLNLERRGNSLIFPVTTSTINNTPLVRLKKRYQYN